MRHSSMKVNTFDVAEYALQGEDIDVRDKIEKLKLKNNANRVMKTLSQRKSVTGRINQKSVIEPLNINL